MTDASSQDRFRAVLALMAAIGTVIFNVLAAIGYVNGVTPKAISAKYETVITPAGYAFSIWTLIYVGIIAFSVYQLLPRNIVRFRVVRTVFIASCVLNCAWIFFWHQERIGVCLVIIVALAAVLGLITYLLRSPASFGEALVTSAVFGLYFGWVSCAALVNLMVALEYSVDLVSGPSAVTCGVVLLSIAGIFAIVERVTLGNFIYPLAVAWALAAVAVKQSGNTPIVVAAVIASLAAMITAGTVVTQLKDSTSE
jgi:benzodiazapine receptor